MNKQIITLSLAVILVGAIIGFKIHNGAKPTKKFAVGILQTASHPALDQAREGFMSTLRTELNDDIDFIVQNFEGNTATGMLMAQSLKNTKNLSGIFAIATPAAQLAVSTEKEKPIFIAAVTNPKILTADEILPNNLFGSTDMISIDDQVVAIKSLLPEVRTIAILFNQAEANSNFLHEKMQQTFTTAGFTTKRIGVTSEAELGNQVKFASKQADLIIAPTDNLVATTASFIADMCLQAKIPFIVSDPLLVPQGPLLAAGGIDYKKSGAAAGALAAKELQGLPLEEKFANARQTKVLVNKKTMHALGLDFKSDAIDFIE
jgi:putative tryptophan/tyrosine transport system substrate-binding protein